MSKKIEEAVEDFLAGEDVVGTDHPGSAAPHEFHISDKLQVKLHDGRTVDATIRAIVDDGDKLQVDFGHEATQTISIQCSYCEAIFEVAGTAAKIHFAEEWPHQDLHP